MIKSIYIHIPFCKNICSYCDFCKNYYNKDIIDKYLDALNNEVLDLYKNEEIKTLYIGGGTPSSLSLKELDKLFSIISKINLSKVYEFTFECNYDDITEELLKKLKLNKVNRLSIGIESFNEKFSKLLNRKINKKEMLDKINLSKKYFDNISIDLMYGMPGQTLEDLNNDIDMFLKLDITHVSLYSLILEEHTKLYLKVKEEVDEDVQSSMYNLIVNKLSNKYKRYEISNFSKEKYESKHNLTYWNNLPYYGFGAGASGFIKNVRYTNTKSVFKYINERKICEKEVLSKEDLMKDEVMLNLRKTSGINKNTFKEKYEVELDKVFNYKNLIEMNLINETEKNVFIMPNRFFVSNEIIIMFLDSYIKNN